MNKTNRRNFLKASFLTAASLSIPVRSWSQVVGANSTIRTAIVGINGRGGAHISGMSALADKGVRIVGYCDIDSNVLNKGIAAAAKKNQKLEAYSDIRKMLENPDIDVVTIATPNHW
ncbi:MAG TPA: Gfo/Idh/MocA family oxidoreductase, partial [Roseimicrobium sp.]|nr:Gfo/Idh/MocA family oxidoreductase [Roseimicrobium sp.]